MKNLRVGLLVASASMAACLGCNPAPQPSPSPAPAPKTADTATPMPAPESSPSITPSSTASSKHSYTTDDILTCTVSECWQLAGRNEDGFFDIVQQLAVMSANHRHLRLPQDEEAGKKAGEYIKEQAKQDRGQLLYAIVDGAVRKVAQPEKQQ